MRYDSVKKLPLPGNPEPEVAATATPASISLAWLLLGTLGNALAALVLGGVIAGRAGVPIGGALLLAAAVLGGLTQLVARVRLAVGLAELAAMLLAILMLGGTTLALAWPSLLPLGISVDAVHHLQLIDWIAGHRALPPINGDTQGLLGEMNAYPPGFALIVIAAAWASGRPALEAMYPTIALIGALTTGMVVLLAAYTAPAHTPRPGAYAQIVRGLALLVGPLLLLAHRTFFVEAYIDHSYYTMVLGVFLTLLAIGRAIIPVRWARADAAQFGLALAALVATYPLWVPLPAALAALLLVRRRAAPLYANAQVWLAFAPALAIALADLPPRLAAGQAVLAHQGLVALPTLARLAPIVLALPGAGLLLAARQARGLICAAALTLGAALALALLGITGQVASYHAYKLLFVLTPLAAAIVAAATARLLASPQPARQAAALLGILLALMFSGSLRVVPPRPIQLLSPELVAAARWLRTHDPAAAARAPLAGAPLGPLAYWVEIGLLGQRRDTAEVARRDLTAAQPAAESWLIDDQQPPVALVARLDRSLVGTHVLQQVGAAAIIERDQPLDIAALNPLTIRYKTFWEDQRLKTAIELRHPLPGRLPTLEIGLDQAGAPINRFALGPDQQRTRPQYLGVDLLPATLGGEGYINVSDYPTFPAPTGTPAGALTLTLRLLIDGQSVDERTLATFTRAADGQIDQLATSSGELVYLRHDPPAEPALSVISDFDDELRLAGWSHTTQAQPGHPLTLSLHWQALRPISQALLPELRLLDDAGQPVASALAPPQSGFYPTWRWRAGETVIDQQTLELPATLTPGSYRLSLRVHDFAGQRLLGNGGSANSELELGKIVIE